MILVDVASEDPGRYERVRGKVCDSQIPKSASRQVANRISTSDCEPHRFPCFILLLVLPEAAEAAAAATPGGKKPENIAIRLNFLVETATTSCG